MKPTKLQASKRCQTLEMFTTSNSWAIPKTQPAGRKPMIQVKLQKLQPNKMGCAYFLLFSCVLQNTTSNKKRLLYSHGKPIVPTQLLRALRTQVRWGFPTEASAGAAVPPNQLLDAGWPRDPRIFSPTKGDERRFHDGNGSSRWFPWFLLMDPMGV